MYIQPNTVVRLMAGVPLDKDYNSTVYFSSIEQQASAFAPFTLANGILSAQYYQRENRDYIRVNRPIGQVRNCNYLSFKNDSYGGKTFYAFVDSIEFVNNETTELRYTIDYMQSYFFDYEVPQAFIERESPAYDNRGDNLLPEKLDIGEYLIANITNSGFMNSYSIVVATTVLEDLTTTRGGLYSGIFSGVQYIAFTDAVACADFIEEITKANKSDAIVSIFMMPTDLLSSSGTTESPRKYLNKSFPTSIGNYTPRNKKLLTAPFTQLYATTYNGQTADYPYEYFGGSSADFMLTMGMSCNPTGILAPMNYKGSGVNPSTMTGNPNLDEKLTLNGFPQCSYNIDTFKAWLAQNAIPLGMSLAGNAIGLVTGLSSGNTSVLSYNVNRIAETLGTVIQKSTEPPHARGTQSGDALCGIKELDFHIMEKHITEFYARIIDSYFDKFGYATHITKQIKRNNRELWTFVKTIDADIHGRLPNNASQVIASIYNKGVTFWKNISQVNNYSLASQNTPLEGSATV